MEIEIAATVAALIVLAGGLGLGWTLVTLARGLWAVGTLRIRGHW